MLEQLKRMLSKLSDEKGVSLIEVVIILVILAITVAPLGRLSVQNMKSGGDYVTMTRTMSYAQGRMEEIVADYSSASRGYDWVKTNWSGVADSPSTGLSRTVSISSETVLNGVTYVVVTTTVSGSGIEDVQLKMWLVDND